MGKIGNSGLLMGNSNGVMLVAVVVVVVVVTVVSVITRPKEINPDVVYSRGPMSRVVWIKKAYEVESFISWFTFE